MEWWIVPQENTAAAGTASYQTDIYVDVDSSKKSSNCIYNSSSCKKPDRFKFLVSADGRVIPADPMGLMYINTRKSFLKNKNQKIDGDTAIAVDLDTTIKNFNYEPCVEVHEQGPSAEEECLASGGVWDAATNTCGEPGPTEEEKCIASGGIWGAASNVCREPEPEPEPQEPEFDPSSVQVTFTFVPLVGMIQYDINGYGSDYREFGLYARVKINKRINYDVRAGVAIRHMSDSSEYYICTIPRGRTGCVTKVINGSKLPANGQGGWNIFSPFASLNDSNNTSLTNITSYNKDAFYDERMFRSCGGYTFSTKESYKDSTRPEYIPEEDAVRLNTFYKVGVLSGLCPDSSKVYSSNYCGSSSNPGREWFFNDVDSSLLTGKTSFDNNKYEIIEASKVMHPEYYQ